MFDDILLMTTFSLGRTISRIVSFGDQKREAEAAKHVATAQYFCSYRVVKLQGREVPTAVVLRQMDYMRENMQAISDGQENYVLLKDLMPENVKGPIESKFGRFVLTECADDDAVIPVNSEVVTVNNEVVPANEEAADEKCMYMRLGHLRNASAETGQVSGRISQARSDGQENYALLKDLMPENVKGPIESNFGRFVLTDADDDAVIPVNSEVVTVNNEVVPANNEEAACRQYSEK